MLAILGGGIAGLAAAFEAERLGLPHELFEASSELGGNARTFEAGEFRFDAGAHRLHDRDSGVTARVREWLGDDLHEVDAPSRILHRGSFLDFPLEPWNLLRSLPPGQSVRAALGFIRARLGVLRARRLAPPAHFAEFAVQRFGRALAEPFLIRYSEKLWGHPADQLSVEIAGRRLEGLGLRGLLRRTGPSPHLEGSFLYPRGGIGGLAQAMITRCNPGALQTNAPVTAIEHDGRRATAVVVGGVRRVPVQHVVSTLPLALQTTLLSPGPSSDLLEAARSLEYRHVILVAVFLRRERVSRYVSTYFPDPRWPFTRVHEPKARSTAMAPAGQTSLVAELVRFDSDEDWNRDDAALIDGVTKALIETGLVASDEIVGSTVRRLRNAYPVLRTDARLLAERLRGAHDRFENVDLVGRAATFRYLHMHDLMRSAFDVVAALARRQVTRDVVGQPDPLAVQR